MSPSSDIEQEAIDASKQKDFGLLTSSSETADATDAIDDSARAHELQENTNVLRLLRKGEEWLDGKMGIETRGIDRIPEEEKRPPALINIMFIWFSFNINVGVVPLGVLGPEFGLSLNHSIGASILGVALGSMCVGFAGTLGPMLGMRSVATARYSFGFWVSVMFSSLIYGALIFLQGAKLCAILNVIVCGGFSIVNVVVVGQMLSAVLDYTMSITVGIVIVSVIGYVVSVFGFRVVQIFEKYSWIFTFILMLVLIGQAAPHVDPSLPSLESGLAFSGAWLSILAINFAGASGWSSMAADYYCNYPASTPRWLVFLYTWLGLTIGDGFSTIIGCCLGNAAVTATYPPYADAYENHGLGGLIAEAYHPRAWSKFCLVILTFSVLGNNIGVYYSSGLDMQFLGHYFHAVPRFIWSFIDVVVILILAVVDQSSLSTIVNDFVSLLGYWTISFTLILLIEDQVFRKRSGYNLNAWDRAEKLPLGVAAVASLLAGYLGGGVPGMAQTWYIGPIAAKFGPYGGDVGVFMSGAITLLVYPPARWYERRITGR